MCVDLKCVYSSKQTFNKMLFIFQNNFMRDFN